MTSDATRAAALRLAKEHGLDPQEIRAAMDAARELPPKVESILAGLGDALSAVAVAGQASDGQVTEKAENTYSKKLFKKRY